MCVYLRAKFEVSSIILTSLRPEGVQFPPHLPPQNKLLKRPSRLGLKDVPFLRLRVKQEAFQLPFFSPLSLSSQSFWTDSQKFSLERFIIRYPGSV